MFHACFISTFLCFVHTLEYFYTFSGTNLLTRCHSASCLFSAVFGFRKASKEIFSELDRTKAQVNILPKATRSSDESQRGAPGRPHPRVAWPALATPPPGVGSPALHQPCPFAYIPPGTKTQRTRSKLHERVCSCRPLHPKVGRDLKLFPATCRRGEITLEAFFITMTASGVMRE